MATRYAIQHKTSRRFLSAHPGLGEHMESPEEKDAVSFGAMTTATLWLLDMGEFAEAWEVVPVKVEQTEPLHSNSIGAPVQHGE